MLEVWYGDWLVDICTEEEARAYREMGGYTFVWCEGYGP